MQLIGAGFGRTGTMSLKAALEELGVGPCYHMIDLIRGEDERVTRWDRAIAGVDAGDPVDWDHVLEGYRSTVDWPGCTFYRPLMEAYPRAKVLLSVRDPDAWYESTCRSIYAATLAARAGQLSGGESLEPHAMRMMGTLIWAGTFDGRFAERDHAIAVYNRHNDEVRATVPAARLLEYEVGEGWEPMAAFLGLEVPETAFPHLNDTDAFREMVGLPPLAR